jgi:predicted GNAT family acetyltransferase
MTVLHKKTGNKGMFFVEFDDEISAEMVYTMASDGRMIIEHTEVDDVLQGRNVGYELVQAGVEYARQHHLKIIPLCSFAKAVFDKKPDFRDVLAD